MKRLAMTISFAATTIILALALPTGAQTQPDAKISTLAAQQLCADRRIGFMEATGFKDSYKCAKDGESCKAVSVKTA